MSDQAMQRHDEGSTVDPQQAKAVDRLLSLSPTTIRHPIQFPNRDATNATNVAASYDKVNSYLVSLGEHYAALSDKVTPHLFAQMCKDYHLRIYDDQAFYVAVYRLFFETNATHLVPGLRAFLPATWAESELWWLNRALEDESIQQRKTARELVGEMATLVTNSMKDTKSSTPSAVMARETDLEATPTPQAAKKKQKRAPINGFRSSYRQRPSDIDTTLRLHDPAPRTNSHKHASQKLLSATRISSSFDHQPPTVSKSPATKKPSVRKANKTKSPTPPTHSASNADTTPSSPTTPLAAKHHSNLPSASSLTHLGPIYASTCAILARPNKPYIHALCGQRFGYPAEVQRHHNGQSGRPGCWEKYGKPEGEAGQWDKDASCKIRLSDLEYVKVQEGWVVTNWGSVNVEGVREGEAGETSSGTTEKEVALETTGKGKKRKGVGKTRSVLEVATPVRSESPSEEFEDADEYMPEEPEAKRQKVEDGALSASGADAAVRAAALGLRTRK